jgi:uncharacterized repeat protein (TIGR03803 family)
VAGLTLAADGSFYGTTLSGGSHSMGTIFKVTSEGILHTLHTFCSEADCADGGYPASLLVEGTDGNFYGTTSAGGLNGYGTAFKMTPHGTLTTLYAFCSEANCVDGEYPYGALAQAGDGNFYGTAYEGGAYGGGTVFEMTPQGNLTTLYSFCLEAECEDGELPHGGLVQGSDGNFYGITSEGGTYGVGTVFEITTGGTLTTLQSFDNGDGSDPLGGLVQAADGNFYGTTSGGGTGGGLGTVFKITAAGALTTLHSFDYSDGDGPWGGVWQATDGMLYGTAESGGSYGYGTAYSLSVGLSRFVETIPAFGNVGENITILGNDLKGSTVVNFSGTPAATFTASSTAIQVTVPAGATTGRVEVVTASGRVLKSNEQFQIIP